MPQTKYRYTWKPDLPDCRDKVYADVVDPEVDVQLTWWQKVLKFLHLLPVSTAYPKSVDLRDSKKWPPVYDQGELGSCVENAWCADLSNVTAKEGTPGVLLSRLFLYYEVRGGVPDDTGSTIRDGVKTVSKVGVCSEDLWKYDLDYWTAKPPQPAYDDAIKRKAIVYARLNTLDDMLHCLASGYAIVYGMSVYEPFEYLTKSNNVLPMPKKTDRLMGGHALCIVGYSLSKKCFLVRNSWGTGWGADGYFWLPFAYATDRNLSDDFWTVRKVPVAKAAAA